MKYVGYLFFHQLIQRFTLVSTFCLSRWCQHWSWIILCQTRSVFLHVEERHIRFLKSPKQWRIFLKSTRRQIVKKNWAVALVMHVQTFCSFKNHSFNIYVYCFKSIIIIFVNSFTIFFLKVFAIWEKECGSIYLYIPITFSLHIVSSHFHIEWMWETFSLVKSRRHFEEFVGWKYLKLSLLPLETINSYDCTALLITLHSQQQTICVL